MKPFTAEDQLLANAKKIHMIGIGGSGMFPLAQILHSKGYLLTGSDNNESDILAKVRKLGIPVTLGHRAENIGDAQLVVYSAAIQADNPEREEAQRRGIPTLERSFLLGYVTRQFDSVIGVCGTHGKTTVTSMITQILHQDGQDPSAVIGGYLKAIEGYGRAGSTEHLVCESCEYNDTFLKLSPDTCLLLNIDRDHLEYFKTVENLKASFRKFAEKSSVIICNGDDENTMDALSGIDKPIITFGWGKNNDYSPDNIIIHTGVFCEFDLLHRGAKILHISLRVPGRHNILNAVAAAAAALHAGARKESVIQGLSDFAGAGRRFEILAEKSGITFADDYAHHPAELTVTLNTAMKMGFKRVWAVFQPFTFSRTKMLLEEFAQALSIPDRVVMSAIMGSREYNTYGISTQDLADRIPGSVWFETFEEIADFVTENARAGDLVITLGCGDIYKAARMMIEKFDQ